MILLMSISPRSYSQEFFTKELRWSFCDSNVGCVYKDTIQIIEWGKNYNRYSSIKSETLHLKNGDVFILIVDICSGLYCPLIYVFQERNMKWQLIASAQARLNNKLEIENKNDKIIFKTKSGQVGELSINEIGNGNNKK